MTSEALTGRAGDLVAMFDVLDGGLLTTVQDFGRPNWIHLGVPESGAADRWSLAVANLLVANDPGAAALELTLVGPTLAVLPGEPLTIGLAGADLGARIVGGRRLRPGRSHRLSAGDIVEIPGDGGSRPRSGSRAYLAVPGGVDVPTVLGSRATCLAAAFGGFAGRGLRRGDRIAARPSRGTRSDRAGPARAELVWPEPWPEAPPWPAVPPWPEADPSESARLAAEPDPEGAAAPTSRGAAAQPILRVLAGPDPGLEELVARRWRVAAAADRVGVRLDGQALPAGIAGETTTHGVPWGAIQVPPDGRPIVLGVDHQSTGGYRVPAVVISADLPVLGQLRPGDAVRIVAIDRAGALEALRHRREALAAGAAALRDAAGWSELIDSAGG